MINAYWRRGLPTRFTVLSAHNKYKRRLKAVAVESTFNWYWLVDGLQEAGFQVELVNTTKVIQYSGLKRADDHVSVRPDTEYDTEYTSRDR